MADIAKHNKSDDCWVSIAGQGYNLSKFMYRHPGGKAVILKMCGKEATQQFSKFHPLDVIHKMIKPEEKLGHVKDAASVSTVVSPVDKMLAANRKQLPPLGKMLNLYDFENVARHTMNRVGWYYYSSGSDDEVTLRENHRAFQRIWFRPKVLVDVSEVDTSSTMLGHKTSAPFYVSATAMAGLANPEAERPITRACSSRGIIQMLSTLASCSLDDIAKVLKKGQPLWYQVYVNGDRQRTAKIMKRADDLGVSAFVVTVDAPQLGHREKDMRVKFDDALADVQSSDADTADRSQGVSRAVSSFIDPSLSWKDIPWLRKVATKPLLIKGIQRWEDAVKAAEVGFDGIIISNHGGRQLDGSRPSIEVLAEVMDELKKRQLDQKVEVYVDGGIRRGTDVLKAICLGAKGVGVGRPILYALSTYGEDGVKHAMDILKQEIANDMKLLGVSRIDQLGPDLIDARALTTPFQSQYKSQFERTYEAAPLEAFQNEV